MANKVLFKVPVGTMPSRFIFTQDKQFNERYGEFWKLVNRLSEELETGNMFSYEWQPLAGIFNYALENFYDSCQHLQKTVGVDRDNGDKINRMYVVGRNLDTVFGRMKRYLNDPKKAFQKDWIMNSKTGLLLTDKDLEDSRIEELQAKAELRETTEQLRQLQMLKDIREKLRE